MKRTLFILIIATTLFALDLPKVAYTQNIHITPESDYNIYKLIREGESYLSKGQNKKASNFFIKALLKAKRAKGNRTISQYDFLIAKYGLLKLTQNNEDLKDYKKMAKSILHFLDKTTNKGKDIWEEGDLGKLQLDLYRNILNNYANILYKESNRDDKKLLKSALSYAKRAKNFIRSDEDSYIKETNKKIENAIAGNPPLKDEKEVQIVKIIKNDTNSTENALKK
jgi:tetratricopeptide (TPR) repeat protein